MQRRSEGERQLVQKTSNDKEDPVSPFELGDEGSSAIKAVGSQSAKKNMHFTSRSVFSFPMLDDDAARKLLKPFKASNELDQQKQEDSAGG